MKRFIETYNGEHFDVIVIGGGITGAAVAYDAASRGLSVALVEKRDFGCATSAATSKLIHGGLRYLANLEFGLVRESLMERRTLENIAPNFVYPLPSILPHFKEDSLTHGKNAIKIAMMLYDTLSYDKKFTWDKSKKIPSHRFMPRNETIEMEPYVKDEGLVGASRYFDCQSLFPERLTLAFIKSASSNGASVANYCEVESFIKKDDNKIVGVTVRDTITGRVLNINGALVINCAGPWADMVLNMARNGIGQGTLKRSEGIHLITKKLVNENMIGMFTPKGGHVFLIPWRDHTLIGITDKEYNGNPDDYRVTGASVKELLDDVNSCLGINKIAYTDVQYAYGGLRPLLESEGKSTYKASRKYEITDNESDGLNGLITVEGGKYTTSRSLAEKVVDLVGRKIGKKLPKTTTSKKYLVGSDIKDMEVFLSATKARHDDFPKKTVDYLARIYGTEVDSVLAIAGRNKLLCEPMDAEGEMPAQVEYAVKNEMAKTLGDIIFRRTSIGTLGNPGNEIVEKIAIAASKELGWSDARTGDEIESVKRKFILE